MPICPLAYYAVRYEETVLSLYRMADNAHVRDFPMPLFYRRGANVGDFIFSGTGRYLIIRYNGGGLVQWEVETGKLLRILSADARMQNYSWPPSFTTDDRLMACHMTGTAGTQFVYDLEKGEVREMPSYPPELKYAAGNNRTRLSPDGAKIAAMSSDMVIVFDAMTGAERHRTKAGSQLQMITWDRTGEQLAYSCDDNTISLWTPATGRTVQLGGTALLPWKQDFSPDGKLLATGGQDGITRLWDTDSARLLTELKSTLGPSFSADGRHLAGAAAGQSVSVWRIESPAAMSIYQGKWRERATVWQLDMSPDGKTAFWSPPWWVGRNGVEILNLERGTSIVREKPQRVICGLRPGHAQYWTTGAGVLDIFPLPADGASVEETPLLSIALPKGFRGKNVAFSALGQHFAVGGPDRTVFVFDLNAPDKPVKMEPVFSGVDDASQGPGSPTGGGVLVMSPDGSRAAVGYYVDRGQPVIWDTKTGKIVKRLDCGTGLLSWSPDGRFLAVSGTSHVHLFSTADWTPLWKRKRDRQLSYFGSVCFSGDSSLIACTMSTTRLELFTTVGESLAAWDLKELKFISNPRITADGQKIIAGGMEGRKTTLPEPMPTKP